LFTYHRQESISCQGKGHIKQTRKAKPGTDSLTSSLSIF
jgi:hypothetical protein